MTRTKIDEIARRITPENIKLKIEKTNKMKLPADLQKWVKGYKQKGCTKYQKS